MIQRHARFRCILGRLGRLLRLRGLRLSLIRLIRRGLVSVKLPRTGLPRCLLIRHRLPISRLARRWLHRITVPRRISWHTLAGGILFPAGGVGGTGRASLRILPSAKERSLNLGGILRGRICLNGVKVVVLPRRLLLVHEPGCLNRVRPLGWRFLRRYQGRRRTRRVKPRAPEQTPRLVSVAQRMGAPGQYWVG